MFCILHNFYHSADSASVDSKYEHDEQASCISPDYIKRPLQNRAFSSVLSAGVTFNIYTPATKLVGRAV